MRYEDAAYIEYGNVKISNIGYGNVRNLVSRTIRSGERGYVCLNDVSNIVTATRDAEMLAAINGSLLSLADGMPVAWYARLVGCREIERISGASLMERLLTDLAGCRHYLLGDTEQTIEKVMARARELNSKVEITGHSPPFKEFTEDDNLLIMEQVRRAAPDIVWVSFGGNKQEKWMKENIGHLDHGVMIGAGAAFKWLIGEIVTPPEIFQKMGLQWLFRLIHELVKDPGTCLSKVRERKLLTNKMVFVANLPYEIRSARQQLKMMTTGRR